MTCPSQITLSALPAATSGIAKTIPAWLKLAPRPKPAPASWVSEWLLPKPSRSPAQRLLSLLMPTLLNAPDRLVPIPSGSVSLSLRGCPRSL